MQLKSNTWSSVGGSVNIGLDLSPAGKQKQAAPSMNMMQQQPQQPMMMANNAPRGALSSCYVLDNWRFSLLVSIYISFTGKRLT
jgi:hypothetical protein